MDKFPNLFKRPRKEQTEDLDKKKVAKVFNNWLYTIAEDGIAGDLEKVGKLSIWEVCDILNYKAQKTDKERQAADKHKIRSKKR